MTIYSVDRSVVMLGAYLIGAGLLIAVLTAPLWDVIASRSEALGTVETIGVAPATQDRTTTADHGRRPVWIAATPKYNFTPPATAALARSSAREARIIQPVEFDNPPRSERKRWRANRTVNQAHLDH